MTLAQSTMVRRVRDILGEDVKWQTLATAANASDTSVEVTDGTDWNEGSILEWEEDGDQAYIQSVSANILTAIRGVNGTTATGHAGTAATKDPIYPFIKVTDAIDATIQTLWPYAWKTVDASIITGPSTIYYSLGNNVVDLVRAWQEDGSTVPVARYFGTRGTGKPIMLFPNASTLTGVTTDFAVGFPNSTFHATNTIHVQYRAFVTDELSGSDYTDLSEGALSEILCWGAAARLVRTRASAQLRNDSRQWNSTVELDGVLQSADFYYAEYRRLLMDYHDYLLRTNPPMRTWSR